MRQEMDGETQSPIRGEDRKTGGNREKSNLDRTLERLAFIAPELRQSNGGGGQNWHAEQGQKAFRMFQHRVEVPSWGFLQAWAGPKPDRFQARPRKPRYRKEIFAPGVLKNG